MLKKRFDDRQFATPIFTEAIQLIIKISKDLRGKKKQEVKS